jgi:hypothetical protein
MGRASAARSNGQHAAGPGLGPKAVLLLVLIVVAAIRWRLREMALERDEGEYAYFGQLMLDGFPPYGVAYNMKLPGTYAAYAVVLAVLGSSAGAVHLGLIAVNAATIVLVFALGRRLFDEWTGAVAAAVYGVTSLSPAFLGLAAHATHFVVLAGLAGLWLVLRAVESRRTTTFAAAGVALGLAFVMKQQGAAFVLFGVAYLLARGLRSSDRAWIRGLVALTLGALAPYAITCVVLALCGVFRAFWWWTFDYARAYGSFATLDDGWRNLKSVAPGAWSANWAAIGLAAVGALAVARDRSSRPRAGFLFGALICTIPAVCAGLHFRHHYFILLLPLVALFAGAAIFHLRSALASQAPRSLLDASLGLAVAAVCACPLLHDRQVLFELDPASAARAIYPGNPLVESLELAHYIADHTQPDDRICVFGSEPQIYFYAHRRGATGYIYTYPLMEPHALAGKMQDEMIAEIEAARPKFLLKVNVAKSWLMRPTSDKRLFTWAERYLAQGYTVIGAVKLKSKGGEFVWGDAARAIGEQLPDLLLLYERQDSSQH